ncbi:MAG TPA: MerR family transcriptional regulator, partial [Pirellulaceae bacterium]|nr:MerR family transcriptional regulator [Pirellulaceae bacterium]
MPLPPDDDESLEPPFDAELGPEPTRPVDDSASPLRDRRVMFVGKLGGLTKREAQQVVRQHGGVAVDQYDSNVDLIVIGADELPLGDDQEGLPDEAREAAAEQRLEIISETDLWQRLGLVDSQQHVRRLYTPAMLAKLLQVSVATIRRWHRRGLIVPAREVHRLPYFDFAEVSTARRLAQLVAAGASPAAIEKKLAELSRYVPGVDRPIAQLSIIVEGRQLLLRQDEGLIEPGGQRRIDFDALESLKSHTVPADNASGDSPPRDVLPIAPRNRSSGQVDDRRETAIDDGRRASPADPSSYGGDSAPVVSLELDDYAGDARSNATSNDRFAAIEAGSQSTGDELNGDLEQLRPASAAELADQACQADEDGDLEGAVELYRAALAAGGPDASLCFQLAELLYRQGDLSAARERYYMAVEIDEDFVEARANLGCLLAELGQLELAAAAFEGALKFHADYPDAHYH